MNTTNPGAADAIEYLRQSGNEALALVVESLVTREAMYRKSTYETLEKFYALQRLHEPRPQGPRDYRSPPDADG